MTRCLFQHSHTFLYKLLITPKIVSRGILLQLQFVDPTLPCKVFSTLNWETLFKKKKNLGENSTTCPAHWQGITRNLMRHVRWGLGGRAGLRLSWFLPTGPALPSRAVRALTRPPCKQEHLCSDIQGENSIPLQKLFTMVSLLPDLRQINISDGHSHKP